MAKPRSRQELKDYCLRKLGWPVIQINVDDDQLEDRIDEAMSYYMDYHYDATEKQYYKHQITANNFPDRLYDIDVWETGTGYSNTDTITITGSGTGEDATAELVTFANGGIQSVTLTDNGRRYATAPTVTINTSTGSGASLEGVLGGFIPMPENIIGVVDIFPLYSSLGNIADLFSAQFQIISNEIWSLSNSSLVPYYTTIQHLNLIQQILVGRQPIRYTRHRNRVHVDMEWAKVAIGTYLIVECAEVIDPAKFPDVWSDRWLLKYCTALFKRQWGNHLTKYKGMAMPGGIEFNGAEILASAEAEIAQLESDMLRSYGLVSQIYMG